MSVSDDIYIVGGGKGGTGKSLVSMALIDALTDSGRDIFLLETDNANPDVLKAYAGAINHETLDLDQHDSWPEFVTLLDTHRSQSIVVNTGARNGIAITKYGGTLNDALPFLERKVVTLWVINTQMDSLNLLRDFMKALPDVDVSVVRNTFFGDEVDFKIYNESNIRKEIETRGGKSLTFPSLASRVCAYLYGSGPDKKRMPIAEGLMPGRLPLGDRVELGRWRTAVRKMLNEIYDG